MFTRALIFSVLVAGAAHAQDYAFDADGDGDVDADDWQVMQPPAPDSDYDYDQYPGEQAPAYAPTQQQFEQQLSPYGAWYDEPGVGRVWQPSPYEVGSDFTPYTTGGNWAYTNAGWQFATTYRFGSAPFHYGRWYRSPRFGWVWWPQYQWAPHWVDWRCNRAGNIAWAPLAPPGVRISFGVGAPSWSFAYGRYHRPHVQSWGYGRHYDRHDNYRRAAPSYNSGGGARYYGGGRSHGGGWGGGGRHGGGHRGRR